jgi:hypothetical protein
MMEAIVGVLQEKYGWTRERAAEEVEKRVTVLEAYQRQ